MQIKSSLNQRAQRMCDFLEQLQGELRLSVQRLACGTRVIDCGVQASGGIRAGLHLAELCLAGLAEVKLVQLDSGPQVQVCTDHPVAACMASQYAGWQVSEGDYFAMGSGPMRAAAKREPLIQELEFGETAEVAVGVLESSKLPPVEVCQSLAAACGVTADRLTLCVARTASQAGTVQVVARSVETAMHKLHELGFDLNQVHSGLGTAPLPPVAADDMQGIGRTNDAVLYGGHVTLWVDADDGQLNELIGKVPSAASSDFGQPFEQIMQRVGGDFYQIDPLLFSPAKITLVNLRSGKTHQAGELRPDIVANS